MANIKLVYIDKDKWEDEICLFKAMYEIDEELNHDFICYNNIVSLEHDSNNTTICTLDNLMASIRKKATQKYTSIMLIDFNISLEYIFLELMDIAKTKNVDIYILNKSKFAIRSNVSMTIDLDEYDTETEFDTIKSILEKNLNDSLENARRSKKPEHASDLGIFLSEEKNSPLSLLFKSLGLEDFMGVYEDLEDDYDFSEDDEEVEELLKSLLDDKYDTNSIIEGDVILPIESNELDENKVNLGVKINNNIYEISDMENTIRINKAAAKKLIRMLEVVIDD